MQWTTSIHTMDRQNNNHSSAVTLAHKHWTILVVTCTSSLLTPLVLAAKVGVYSGSFKLMADHLYRSSPTSCPRRMDDFDGFAVCSGCVVWYVIAYRQTRCQLQRTPWQLEWVCRQWHGVDWVFVVAFAGIARMWSYFGWPQLCWCLFWWWCYVYSCPSCGWFAGSTGPLVRCSRYRCSCMSDWTESRAYICTGHRVALDRRWFLRISLLSDMNRSIRFLCCSWLRNWMHMCDKLINSRRFSKK